ncbi:MAG: hypothetical protein EB154_09265, partial [Nitrosopumilaceae archaeon]|nr:hypothetical protein [Nitrosopumilaceae archaeon]
TDTGTFIQANSFFKIPKDLEAYYIEAKPPGFDTKKFLGLLSLELRDSKGKNLSGYMVVENDLPTLGNMHFYQVPLNSTTKLIGPTAVREALEKDNDFAQLKTLLRNPRIGDNILYRVGEHDVYFIPVYTAGSSEGVVAQLGTIAFLEKLSGVVPTSNVKPEPGFDKDARIAKIKSIFEQKNVAIVTPTAISAPISFKEGEVSLYSQADTEATDKVLDKFVQEFVLQKAKRVLMWQEQGNVNIGIITTVDGVPELHYVTIIVGK